MTVKELAAYLRVHQSTVYRLIKRDAIPCFKIGSDWRFHVESIDRWLENRDATWSRPG